MGRVRQVAGAVIDVAQSKEFEQFRLNAQDFLSARASGESTSTHIQQMVASLGEATEVLNRSFPEEIVEGEAPRYTNVISPVVVPKRIRSRWHILFFIILLVVGGVGWGVLSFADTTFSFNLSWVIFGPHFWGLLLVYLIFIIWQNSYVMVPDGCQALITRFGKLEQVAGPGRIMLLNPWKRVSYIVNIAKEYPYNAPIREAPTASRINASVDLFLQFRIEDPAEFIFTLGGAKGFEEKLQNAVSEVTRSLIYEQKAEEIYDLVGENMSGVLETLNRQFLPAVRFVSANITHAEPSDPEYRMDLAAAEVVRVAKEAYTYQYELDLRKEQDEGELNKDLASLHENLSEIRAEIAKYQAQIDTAREKETNRANAYAHRLLIEAESEAKANAALLQAQALDVRAASSAFHPEILEYRYQEDILERLEGVMEKLPQIVSIGADNHNIDYTAIARQMLGIRSEALYTSEDMSEIRQRVEVIVQRIRDRSEEIARLDAAEQELAALPGNISTDNIEMEEEVA
jgi:regulator of protease activity HflC (stomatin/prohibitin superfamily)